MQKKDHSQAMATGDVESSTIKESSAELPKERT
jgi:hypothetical protein